MLLMANTAIFAQNYFTGSVLYHNNPEYPIPEVQVDLYDMDGTFVTGTTTNNEGVYVFDNLPDGSYNVELSTTLPGAQITMQDALSILFYMNGLVNYTPIQYLAMDVTNNGVVNFSDFLFIVVQHFVFNQPFPAGEWVFESTTITTGQRDGAGNLGGSRTGDAEGALVPTGRNIISQNILSETENLDASSTQELTIPVYAQTGAQTLDAYGLVIGFDPSVITVLEVIPVITEANLNVSEAEVRMSWVGGLGDQELSIDGKIADIRVLVNNRNPLDHYFPFEVKSESHVVVNGELKNAVYSMPTLSTQHESYKLFPNPAFDQTTVSFYLNDAANVRYQLISSSGQVVLSKDETIQAGEKKINIETSSLASGSYHLLMIKLDSNEILYSTKLIIR